MKAQFGSDIAGLEPSVLGQCNRGATLPKFKAVYDKRFVQILNVGDHFVTVSNVDSPSSHVVCVYDSLYAEPNDSMLVQVSALLRAELRREIVFRFPPFQKQSQGTRLCGYYAVASAVSCLLKTNPSHTVYDEKQIPSHFNAIIRSGRLSAFPGGWVDRQDSRARVHTLRKVYCICHRDERAGTEMIRCDACSHWFHLNTCIPQWAAPHSLQGTAWLGPCCSEF